jgi:hypothetical protein
MRPGRPTMYIPDYIFLTMRRPRRHA